MKTGDKVVCVNDSFDESVKRLVPNRPVKDTVYVVRSVHLGLTPSKGIQPRQSKVKLLLIGLINPCANDGKEHGFNSERFRPLLEKKTVNVEFQTGCNDGDVRIYEPTNDK